MAVPTAASSASSIGAGYRVPDCHFPCHPSRLPGNLPLNGFHPLEMTSQQPGGDISNALWGGHLSSSLQVGAA
jgi:hypothetical protein